MRETRLEAVVQVRDGGGLICSVGSRDGEEGVGLKRNETTDSRFFFFRYSKVNFKLKMSAGRREGDDSKVLHHSG